MRRTLGMLALGSMLFETGCASKYVQAVVRNDTGGNVTLVEVDYPSASFGKEALAAGTEYNYRFKILGNGSIKVLWTDATGKEHSVIGPTLMEGEQGSLTITLTANGATWNSQVHP